MCNLYNIKRPWSNLGDELDALYQQTFDFSDLIVPKADAPGLLISNQQRQLVPMRFGLIPVGQDPASVKRPYNNATIEKLGGWPWKMSVGKSRCVVPMTSFLEFSYWGDEYPGQKLEFFPKSQAVLFVAGMFNTTNAGTSMTLITRPANPQMMDCGHHRMPMFVKKDRIDAWLNPEKQTTESCHNILTKAAHEPEFDIEPHGMMREGWQKRVDAAIAKRDKQLAAIEQNGPLGVSG